VKKCQHLGLGSFLLLVYFWRHFKEIGMAKLLLRLKPHQVRFKVSRLSIDRCHAEKVLTKEYRTLYKKICNARHNN